MKDFRVWGGWALVVVGLVVLMAIGCDNNGLGVRGSNITGKMVRSDSGRGIAGVRVDLYSSAPQSSGGGTAIGQQATVVTDANGVFMFTDLKPDAFILEAQHKDYRPYKLPNTASGTTQTGIYLMNGQMLDLGNLAMEPIADAPLPTNIGVQVFLRDNASRDLLPDNTLVTITFDDISYTSTALGWRTGVDQNGNPIQLPSKSGTYAITIQADPTLYAVQTTTAPGNANIVQDLFVTPNTYNILIRCTNVPDYITGGVVNAFAEIPTTGGTMKVIATQTINNLGNLAGPNLPALMTVPGIAYPIQLRFQCRGYRDEILTLGAEDLAAGLQGNIRIDVNFQLDNGTGAFDYDANTASQAALLDNRMTRFVELVVGGSGLINGDRVIGQVAWIRGIPDPAIAVNQVANIICADVPVGYEQAWFVRVEPVPGSPSEASGSFNISGTTMINPEPEPGVGQFISVDAVRP